MPERPRPIAVWRCPRCHDDVVEWASDEPPAESWVCMSVCRGDALHPTPERDRQMERIAVADASRIERVWALAERAQALAERYGETIIRISEALAAADLKDRGRIMRARGFIVGLAHVPASGEQRVAADRPERLRVILARHAAELEREGFPAMALECREQDRTEASS